MKEIEAKVKLMKGGYTEPNCQVLAKMQVFDEYPPTTLIFWRAAVVKAMIVSTDKNRKGESKYFSTSDISDMFSKYKEFMFQSDEIMAKACCFSNESNGMHIYTCDVGFACVYVFFN